MSLWDRVAGAFGGETPEARAKIEGPMQTLEISYQRQLVVLQDTRRDIADILASEKQLESAAAAMPANIERYRANARDAAERDDDPEAIRSLEREAFALRQQSRLQEDIVDIRTQRLQLEALAEKMSERVEQFRAEKAAIAQTYASTKPSKRPKEPFPGLAAEISTISQMVERARDRTRDVRTRAATLAKLAGSEGALGNIAIDPSIINARLTGLKNGTYAPRPTA